MRTHLVGLLFLSGVGCTGSAEVHANVPPPEARVTVVANTPPPPPQPQPPPPPPTATVVVQTPPPPSASVEVFTPAPEPTVQVVQLRFNVAEGRPAGLHAGASEAFWVWHDGRGESWHVRSTTAGLRHRFQGAVVSDGSVTNVNATDHSFADRVRADAKTIHFDFFTQGGQDGFDFRVAGSQCVRFYMSVDGRSEPRLIHIGRTNAHPGSWHFKLCP